MSIRGVSTASRLSSFVAGALFILVFFLGGATCNRASETTAADEDSRGASGSKASLSLPLPAWAQQMSGSSSTTTIADVAERVTPSVVNLSATKVSRIPGGGRNPFADPFFRHFFGAPFFPFGDVPRERQQKSLGSGVIVSRDGIILTNHHVIEGADSIQVELSDNQTFEATVIGSDEQSDLAVIRIEASDLPAIQIGDSSQLRVGDVVLAVGNPFGVGQTVTMGIVSAVGRANVGITDYEDFIQTDAAINPGNSGGALVNLRGELVGINTAIVSRSGGFNGIGFAIPSNMARSISDSLRQHGRVVRGYLGVMIQDVDPDLARGLGIDEAIRGALVSEVTPDSPASRAGLQREDIIIEVNGEAIRSSAELRARIASLGAGNEARLVVMRSGQRTELRATLGELPSDVASSGEVRVGEGSRLAGVSVSSIGREERQRYGIPDETRGVVVTGIEPGSFAERSGLRVGDVIVEVNRERVASPQEFQRAAERARGDVLLLVVRDGHTLFLAWR